MIKLKNSKGFTLIELLVALAIVGIILLAFFKVIDTTTKMNAKNDRDIKALNIAQSEIENLRNNIKNNTSSENEDINNVIQNKQEVLNKTIGPYKKSIDGKEFNVYLDISKEEVKTENKNIDIGIYLYTINIKVNSVDEYFSKKTTELKNIEILSRNTK